jgi:hypothetical protein
MGEIRRARKVRFITGIMTQFPSAVDQVKKRLEKEFGPSDLSSALVPFYHSPYYSDEMGENLYLRCFSFPKLVHPDDLSEIKIWTNKLERKLASSGKFEAERPVNVDPGYVTLDKVVLASTQNMSHRIYLGDGMYGEITLGWAKSSFSARQWTRADFKSRKIIDFFNKARGLYERKVVLEEA